MAKNKKSTSNQPKQKDTANDDSREINNEEDLVVSEEPSTIKPTGVPLWVCLIVGLFSLAAGLLSPHLYRQVYQNRLRLLSTGKFSTPPELPHQKKDKSTTKMSAFQQKRLAYPCNQEALSQVLHEKPVPGMHVVCMDQSSLASLKLTLWPGAQHTNAPATLEIPGVPEWNTFKQVLIDNFQLRPADNLRQPWAMFSPDGELLLHETNDKVNMEGLVQMGMALIFQGGQFVWPGVRVGFKRTIQLYSIMPAGSPPMDSTKNRTATLETISLEPLVFSVEGFLDDHECDWIQEQATPTLKYSEVTLMDMDQGRPATDFRTSQSTFLTMNGHPIIQDIDYRTASLVRLPRFHQESVQVLRYQGGEKYDAHHDYFDPSLYQRDENTLKNFIQYGRRNRMITVFWYLSDVAEGGETIFPREGGRPPPRNMADCSVGLKVKPRRGKVIIFYSMKPDGNLDPLSLHGACPVKQGVKWAANKWVWNAPIEFGSGQ